jgi:hypothetical protein
MKHRGGPVDRTGDGGVRGPCKGSQASDQATVNAWGTGW